MVTWDEEPDRVDHDVVALVPVGEPRHGHDGGAIGPRRDADFHPPGVNPRRYHGDTLRPRAVCHRQVAAVDTDRDDARRRT